MGMAASQARYLGLTARKTNVEYEGQQVNQQRTALANQSANLFNQLMSLEVPTPPSTQEFTTLQYTYKDGLNTEAIKSYVPLANDPDYNYTVTHSHTESVYKGIEKVKTNPNVVLNAPTYWVDGNLTYDYVQEQDEGAVARIALDNSSSAFRTAYDAAKASGDWSAIKSYKLSGKTYYVCQADLEASRTSGTTPQSALNMYYAADIDEEVSTTERAYIETNDAGRLTKIKLESTPDTEFSLNSESATDTLAYQDAMNQYEYDVQSYEKQVNDINAKTKIIQEQDRTLELRLKQLDTEQEALTTEMSAVKKVIDKNIEQTFKTFS
jgi:hypothetical protein